MDISFAQSMVSERNGIFTVWRLTQQPELAIQLSNNILSSRQKGLTGAWTQYGIGTPIDSKELPRQQHNWMCIS